MPKKNQIKVIKVYLNKGERAPDYPKAFPRLPRLYLELLENKAKIKQHLVNKEHVSSTPKVNAINHDPIPSHRPIIPETPRTPLSSREDVYDKGNEGDVDLRSGDEIEEKSSSRDKYDKYRSSKDDRTPDSTYGDKYDKYRDKEDRDNRDKYSDKEDDYDRDKYKDKYRDKYSDKEDDYDRDKYRDKDDYDRDKYRDKDDRDDRDEGHDRDKEESDDELENRLKELLGESDNEKEPQSVDSMKELRRSLEDQNRYTKHRSPYQSPVQQQYAQPPPNPYQNSMGAPPTLAELQARGEYRGEKHLPDLDQRNYSEQEEEDEKRELIFKFELLKKSYPTAAIPEFSIHSDLTAMRKTYAQTIRRLSLDSTVDTYKKYLIVGFVVVEYVLGHFLNLDMQGFTQQQLTSMSSYDKLLIELGEKSYVPSGSRWPVELRLAFLILINAAFFILGKMIMKKTGANLMAMLNNVSGVAQGSVPRRKRPMRGPSINLDELPDE